MNLSFIQKILLRFCVSSNKRETIRFCLVSLNLLYSELNDRDVRLIFVQAQKYILQNQESAVKAVGDLKSARISVLKLLTNLIGLEILSGKYDLVPSIVPGMLNPDSIAPSLMASYSKILKIMVSEGIMTQVEANENFGDFVKAIHNPNR